MLSVISTKIRSLLQSSRTRTRRSQLSQPEQLETRQLLAAQLVTSSVTSQQLAAGESIQIPVIYQTLDDAGAAASLQANILGFNLHFDSSQLQFDGVDSIEAEGIQVVPNTVRSETDSGITADSDPATDSVLVAAYSDTDFVLNPGWLNTMPASGALLYVANFTALAGFSGTEIHFTANAVGNIVGQTEQFEFQSTDVELTAPAEETISVTGPTGASDDARPTITWTPISGAMSYELWLEQLGGEGNPVVNPTVTQTSYTLTQDLPLSRYRAWVRANLTDGSQTAWSTGDFQVNPAPIATELPFHGDDTTPTISWTAVDGATGYRVFVSNLTSGDVTLDTTVNGTSYTSTEEFEFGRHRIWVRAIGAGSYQGAWSEALKYYIGPDLIGPSGSSFNLQPTLQWDSLPTIGSYQLLVQKGSQVVINESGITSTSFAVTNDLEIGEYRWWLRPSHTNGKTGTWSELGTFYAGGRPTITGPIGVSTSATPTISWDAVEGAGSYEVYVYNDDGEGLQQREYGVTGTSLSTIPVPDGAYRVWVRSYDTAGDVGLWSRAHSFTVDAATTSLQVSALSPSTPTFESIPEFSWASTQGAATYDIYLTNGEQTIQQADITGTTWSPAAALEVGEWTWWLRAKDASGAAGPWSDAQTTDTSGRPVLLSVSDTQAMPTIVWTPVINATRYTLTLDNVSTGENTILREDNLTSSQFTLTESLPAGEYRAWVRAFEDSSAGPWSFNLVFVVE